MPFPQKRILITGGNRGIGKGLVEAFASDHQVFFTTRHALDVIPSGTTQLVVDITDAAQVKSVLSKLEAPIDIVINNAGVFQKTDASASILETPYEDFLNSFQVNTTGTLAVCRAVVPLMPKGGRIINISTGMAQLSDMGTGSAAYRVSKTALNALTKILAGELKSKGISVNAVCPGWVQTDMGGPHASRTVAESVRTIKAFALWEDFPTGCFVRDGKPLDW